MSGVGEIEQAVLSVTSTDQIAQLLKQGVDKSYFVQYSEVFEFIINYFHKYSKIPAKTILEKRFTFEYKKADDYEWYVDCLMESKIRRDLSTILDNSMDHLEKDAIVALDYLAGKITTLKSSVSNGSHMSYTDRDASKRAEEFADKIIKVNQDKVLGIPTGIEIFDNTAGGWMPGQLTSIIGRLEEGKSWLLQYFCVAAYKAGRRILFLSPEMTVGEVELRFDSLVSKSFSNMSLSLGRPGIDINEYKEYLDKLEKRDDWITYDSVPGGKNFTISSIQGLVHLHKPDILAVDGVPLISDENGSDTSWQKMANVGYGLKGIAMNNSIVVLATSQANRESATDRAIPKLHQIAYGDALGQACDKVIGLVRISDNRIKIALVKNRGGRKIGEILFNFMVDLGDISQYVATVDEDLDDEVFNTENF